MSTPVVMPQLGESVTEGTVTRWLKQVGDHVEADEPLLEVSTDKVDTEIPAPSAGFLVAISANEDDIVEVGGLLATIGESAAEAVGQAPAPPDEPVAAAPALSPPPPPPATPATPATPAPPPPPPPPPPPATPAPSAPAPGQPAAPGPETGGTEVRLPILGESVTEGTVTRWLKAVGDAVAVDEPLLEISTDKVDTEIPSPVAGTLSRIVVEEDGVVEVGGLLAIIGSGAPVPAAAPAPAAAPPPVPAPAPPAPAPVPAPAPAPAPAPVAPAPTPPPAPAAPPPLAEPDEQAGEPETVAVTETQPPVPETVSIPEVPSPPTPGPAPADVASGMYVTPLVRKLAADTGIDLATVTGTGIGGRIRRQDVVAAAQASRQSPTAPAAPVTAAQGTPEGAAGSPATAPIEPSPLRGTTENMSRLRRVIADRMVDSLRVSAQLTTVVEADVSRIARLRGRVKDQFAEVEGVRLSFLPFFAKAVVESLKTHPSLNASIDMEAGTVTYHDAEHLGVAVDTDRGLLVPVIRDAGELNIAGLARRIADLADRTRTNRVTPDELSGGTFTLTNTGSRGALFDTPIINQPQVAILGTGSVVKRPVVVTGADGTDVIAVRSTIYLALTYDHRLVDGADAARFLSAVKSRLEEGAFEGELGL